MPIQLVCRACRRPLTAPLCWTDETNHVVGQDREPSVPAGLAVRLSNESASSIHGPDGQIVGVHVFSPAGAIATHPDDVPPEALRSTGVDNGCCGSDGSDGPNRACLCGAVVGTEWSDCWTQAELRFHPDAVEAVPAD